MASINTKSERIPGAGDDFVHLVKELLASAYDSSIRLRSSLVPCSRQRGSYRASEAVSSADRRKVRSLRYFFLRAACSRWRALSSDSPET